MSEQRAAQPALAQPASPARDSKRTLSAWLGGIFSLGWLALWFAGLGSRPLGEPDEGRYAEVAREMFVSGNWLTPKLDGFNFFDKPALHYWATGIFYHLFGVHEWTARLWVALTGLLAIVVTGWAGKRLFDARTGWIAAVVLGSMLLFFAGAHLNTIDMSVAAFLSVGISLFLVAQFDPHAESQRTTLNLLGWASLALAVLSKGLIGLVFPAMTLVVFMLWERDWSILRRMSLGWGLLIVLLIAAPWFIAISLRHPDFFDYFFIRQQFSRYLANTFDRDRPWWFFMPVVLAGLFPWAAFLPFSRGGWRSIYAGMRSERFLLCWIVLIFIFFSASHSKLPFYILPIFPALALLVARRISLMGTRVLAWRFAWVSGLALVFAAVALVTPLSTRHLSQQTDLHAALVWLMGGLVALATVSAIGAFMVGKKWQPVTAVSLLAFASLALWQGLFFSMTPLAVALSAAPAAQLMLPLMRADTEVFTVQAYQRGLPFYLQRLVTVVAEDPDDISGGIAARPAGYIADVAGFEVQWRAAPHALALIDPRLLPRFQADGLPMKVVGTTAKGIVIEQPTADGKSSP